MRLGERYAIGVRVIVTLALASSIGFPLGVFRGLNN